MSGKPMAMTGPLGRLELNYFFSLSSGAAEFMQ